MYSRGGSRDAAAATLWEDVEDDAAPEGAVTDEGEGEGERNPLGLPGVLVGCGAGGLPGGGASPGGLGGALSRRRKRAGSAPSAAAKRARAVRSTLVETQSSGTQVEDRRCEPAKSASPVGAGSQARLKRSAAPPRQGCGGRDENAWSGVLPGVCEGGWGRYLARHQGEVRFRRHLSEAQCAAAAALKARAHPPRGMPGTPIPGHLHTHCSWLTQRRPENCTTGEALGLLDDFEYALDGLTARASDRLRRSSAAKLTEFVARRQGRALLQAHGKTVAALGAARLLACAAPSGDATCATASAAVVALLAQEPAIVASLELDFQDKGAAAAAAAAPATVEAPAPPARPTERSSILEVMAHSLGAPTPPPPVDKWACKGMASIRAIFAEGGAAAELGVKQPTPAALTALALQLATSTPAALRRREGGLKEHVKAAGALDQAAVRVGEYAAEATRGSWGGEEGRQGGAASLECAEIALRCLHMMEAATFLSVGNQERLLTVEVGGRRTLVKALLDIASGGVESAGAESEERATLRRECWHAALKVLTNLTNENRLGCRCARASGGIAALCGALRERWRGGVAPDGARDVDGAAAVLGLLVNLIERDNDNCDQLAASDAFTDEASGERLSAAQFLAKIYADSRAARSADGGGDAAGGVGDKAALRQQGEAELAGISVEAPAAIAVACLLRRGVAGRRFAVASALERRGVRAGLRGLAATIADFREFCAQAGALTKSAIDMLEGLEADLSRVGGDKGADEDEAVAPTGTGAMDDDPYELALEEDSVDEAPRDTEFWTSAWS